MRVLSELFDQYRGRSALVVGGGPSVRDDLAALNETDFWPGLTLSANEHGHFQKYYPVDFTFHEDKIHVMKRDARGKHLDMAEYLSAWGKPLMSRWGSADVRLDGWKFKANSGVMAVAVAAALGCSPIVVTGLDFWATGRKYFHEPDDSKAPKLYAWQRARKAEKAVGPDRRLSPLMQFVGDAHIRPLSGLLLTAWPKFDPSEVLGDPPVIQYTREHPAATSYQAVRSFHWSNYDTVARGTVIKLTKQEADRLLRLGNIAPVVSPV